MRDLISAVIPTRNRPDLVCRAVRSALAQTWKDIEIIVVIDGPDEATVRSLKELNEPRMKVVTLPERVGPSGARNTGVGAAKGTWVAFLDDDDEWLPPKLERQVKSALRSHVPFPLIATSFIARMPTGNAVLPERVPRFGQPISEYLFSRASVLHKEGFMITSTLFAKKEFLVRVPFRIGLDRHEDWDVILRAAQVDGVGFEVMSEPLAVWHQEERRDNLSGPADWSSSLEWLRDRRDLVTPRAYAGYVATVVADQASRQRQWRTFLPLLREMHRFGAPGLVAHVLYLAMWLVPKSLRRRRRQGA